MKKYSNSELPENLGSFWLIYGEPGIGKTYSFGTLPDPILAIITEPRDPRRTLNYPEAKGKKIDFVEFETFNEYMDMLDELYQKYEEGTKPYKSICLDSLSFLQSKFKMDFEDDRFIDAIQEKKRSNLLIDKFRIEKADWGGLGSAMKRITAVLNKFSKQGVQVVATATLTENPSWNRDLTAAPAFHGEFAQVLNGYFDFIGLVTASGDTGNPYPPVISFVSPEQDFVAKSCSNTLNEKGGKGILDFKKILKLINS